MFAKPQSEHVWLEKLIGEWTVESECQMGPDQPPTKSESRMVCRSLGGLWVIAESQGICPESGPWNCIMTLGYDPKASQYCGTFVASMMAELWIYSGAVDETGKRLVLDTEGPKFDQTGKTKYQDIIEWIDPDYWTVTSRMLDDEGKWQPFMTAHHRRMKAEAIKEANDEVHAAHLR